MKYSVVILLITVTKMEHAIKKEKNVPAEKGGNGGGKTR
jgi:hypothetical protein